VIASDEGRHTVTNGIAETVSVRAEPSPPSRAPLPEQLELSADRYGR
jgi:DtxR family Mn-dependent transcriptional regulator